MFTEQQLEQTSAQLASFRVASNEHQTSLSGVLESYATLIEDYKRLRSDYEEERDSRERYKQLAKGQERNPFVLVLVDGDGYVFDDDLVSNGADGGQRAAQLLDEAVKRSLRQLGLDHCRIMVRMYANLVGLSKVLNRAKLAGPEKRSLAPFVANFNRSNDLFDMVDAGELKENADSKLRAMLRQFVDNAQCKHIFFAGCHDVGYINELTPHASNRDRITLIRHPRLHPEFTKLGMRIDDFNNIFRLAPLDEQATHSRAASYSPLKAHSTPVIPFSPSAAKPSSTGEAKVCQFYQKGQCKYGKNCKNVHIEPNTNGHYSAAAFGNLSDIKKWRDDGSKASLSPFQMSNLAKSDNDLMSGNKAVFTNHNSDDAHFNTSYSHIDLATKQLPPASEIPANTIPVNGSGYRLDAYIPPPSFDDQKKFNSRTAQQKLCNNHFVQGYCPQGDACAFDHSPASAGVQNALHHVVRSQPCPRKGACRRPNCLQGHVCQKPDCGYRGGKSHCKFSQNVHRQNLTPTRFVDAEAPKALQENGDGSADGLTPESVSIRDSTPKLESEGEAEGEEGALLDMGDEADLD